MFIRQKRNKSGSYSVQILLKENGRNKLLKTIGSSSDHKELMILNEKAKQELERIWGPIQFVYF